MVRPAPDAGSPGSEAALYAHSHQGALFSMKCCQVERPVFPWAMGLIKGEQAVSGAVEIAGRLCVSVKPGPELSTVFNRGSRGSYYGTVWTPFMVNWMKAAALELRGVEMS